MLYTCLYVVRGSHAENVRFYCKCAEPGGYLLLREADIITYNHEDFPPSDLKGPDVTKALQVTSNVAIINRIAVGEPLKQGFVPGYARLLFA
jgi:hypothetical protein